MEGNNKKHISSYTQLGTVLVALLILTTITVLVTWLDFGTFAVAVALIIAMIKGATVMTYFMHLKYDKMIYRVMVIGVFFIFALFIIITLLDYAFR